ncbi:carbon-nitrogen hydrolase family protein [Candidatus Micrarchaeota archaeon]|nr:carbon-nitrogen hydrolase family protein [Candidatus Micrarchaeota archaeon]
MKLALVQMEIAQQQPEKNRKKIELFIKSAKAKKVHVIVFPEDCLTGSVRNRSDLIDRNGKHKRFFQNLAKKYKIDIVTGSFIETNGNNYNTCYYIDANGRTIARYRKINLWLSEREHVNSGQDVIAFNTKYGKVSIAICWDLVNPLIFRTMAKKRVQIVYCPSYWSSAGISNFEIEKNNINALCHARALENELVIAYANAAGKRAKNDELIGHSQVVVPIKGAIARLNHNKEKMIVVDVNLDILKRANEVYKIRDDITKQ